MLSRQEEEQDRIHTLRNDLSVRQQREQEERRRTFAPDQSLPNPGTTFHQHAINDADIPRGRFTAHERYAVIGSTALPACPAAPAWSADPGAQCVEPPLGLDNPAISDPSPVLLSSSGEATGEPPNASPLARGSPLSSQPNPAPTAAPSDACDVERRGAGLGPLDDPATTEGPAPPSASPHGARGLVVGSSPYRRRI
jgi:hypothetical protein